MGIQTGRCVALRVLAGLASFVLFFGVLMGGHAEAADELGLTLATVPGGPKADAVRIRVAPGEVSGSRTVFVRVAGDAALEGALFRATELTDDEDDTVPGSVCVAQLARVSPCSTQGGRATVPAAGEVILYVHVKGLEETGTFTSTLFAAKDGKAQELADLTVTTAKEEGVLTIEEITTARAVKPYPWHFADVELEVTVANGGSRPVDVEGVVRGLSIAGEGDARFGAVAPVPELRRLSTEERAGQGTMIEADDEATFSVTLPNIRHAGGYAGTIRVSAAGVEAATQTFDFSVKDPFWVAAIIIALGVGISMLVRHLMGAWTARVTRQRVARSLLDDIETTRAAGAGPREVGVLEALARRLEKLYDEIDLGTANTIDSDLDQIGKKLALVPLLMRVRGLVDTTEPATIRRPFAARLDAVADFLEEKTEAGNLADDLAAQKQTLANVPEEIRQKVKEQFLADVDAFETQATSNAGAPAAGESILELVAKARAVAENDAEAAREIFEDARKSFATAAAGHLIPSIDAPDDPPPGISAGEWPALRDEHVKALRTVAAAASGDEAMARYRSATTAFLVQVTGRLADAARAGALVHAGDDEKRTSYESVRDKADEAAREAVAEKLVAALATYEEAVAAYEALEKPNREGAVTGSLGGSRRVFRAGGLQLVDALEAPASVGVMGAGGAARSSPTVRALTGKLKRSQLFVSLLVGLVAVVLGVEILWAGDATWGDFREYATAFLWGLGVHEVAGKALDLSSIRAGIGGTPSGDED